MPQPLSKKLLSRSNMTSLEEVHKCLKPKLLKLPKEHLFLMEYLSNKLKRTSNQTNKKYLLNSKSLNSCLTSVVSTQTRMICMQCSSSKWWCSRWWCKTKWIWAWEWISITLECRIQWEEISSWQTTNNREWASKTTKALSNNNNNNNPILTLKTRTNTNSSRITNSKCLISSKTTQQQHSVRPKEWQIHQDRLHLTCLTE